nr:DNA-directed DNA polymerase [Tanacetum cinerariifolium]
MSTRSSTRNLFPPLENPELTIQRRSRFDPTLLNDFEMATEGNGDPSVLNLRTMEELCQPSLNGRAAEGNDDLPVPDLRTMKELCQPSLNGRAQWNESSRSITSSFDTEIAALKAEMAEINKNLMRVLQGANQGQNQPLAYQALVYQASVHQLQIPQPQVVTTNEFTNFMKANDVIRKNLQTNMTSLTNSNLDLKNMFGQFMMMNTASSSGSRTLPGNTITNPKEDLKGITTRSGIAYHGPTIPTTTSSSPVGERETEATKDIVHPTNNGSTKDIKPPVVPTESPILSFEPVISPIIEPVTSLVSAPRPSQRPSIPYQSRLQDQKLTPADLGARINLMPLSVWNKLSLPDLSFTCMTLELVDHLISHLVGISKDFFVKVGTFHFLANFIIVDFDADPRVPLILERSFFKTGRASIDVFEANYNDIMANRIDVIDMACEEYSQQVLSFYDMIASGNPTPYYDLIVSTTSLTPTLFKNSDFLLEEVDAFLALEDDPTLPEVDQSYELKICEAKSEKSLIDEPPEVELKDLPPHLKYAFLEGDEKLPVIIVKDLSVEEKTALITVLKSHKLAIAWKLFDIKGIDLEFYTHIILTEEDFEPAVQHQRRVNPKIYDVIKQENELIPTRLVTGWHVCIDYHKLNEAIRKDHFSLPFMDQMLERLAGNQYYCFLDGFSGYFQIPIDPKDQEKTTFTCPYRTFAYCRMSFGLAIHQARFREKMLKQCEDTNLCLNWKKSHFMVKEGIVLGHKISKEGIEVDKAKVDVIAKLPHPTTVKGIRSFLGHAGFYRRFIQDFSKKPGR